MLRVGVTGGIGSGKSTLSAALALRGAVLVDADAVAREVVEPGQAAYAPLVERFGPGILRDDGHLDRAALAAVAFADPAALADLDAITHPVIGATVMERVAAWEGTDRVVVVDQPLLDASAVARYRLEAVVVVDVDVDVAVGRLVAHRGFAEADARARVAAQASREARLELADCVVDNRGDRDALEREADRVWAWLAGRAGS